MVRHTAETYREAALEHIKLALTLHSELGEYGPAHYYAGLAVECMLRAWRVRHDPHFDSRHDLKQLARDARLLEVLPVADAPVFAAHLADVAARWSNDHRYRPARLIDRWLRHHQVDRQVSRDRLKHSSRGITGSAAYIVQLGEQQWPSRTI